MKNTSIDKLGFIPLKDKRVLVTLSRGKGVWFMSGGEREKGEADKEALAKAFSL